MYVEFQNAIVILEVERMKHDFENEFRQIYMQRAAAMFYGPKFPFACYYNETPLYELQSLKVI